MIIIFIFKGISCNKLKKIAINIIKNEECYAKSLRAFKINLKKVLMA